MNVQGTTLLDQTTVNSLAQQFGFSTDAVLTLAQAVAQGGGTMAQFYHSELGGGGQWMQGGMIMLGDMFNSGLQSRVSGLCQILANKYANGELRLPTIPAWYPSEFGSPNASGGQNDMRYAYFANARRLVIEINGRQTIYDTGNYAIGGVSQQQSNGVQELTFSTPYGTVRLDALQIVSAPSVASNQSTQSAVAPWYSAEFGIPTLQADENGLRYAYFPDYHRITIQWQGQETVYDSANHAIKAVQLQQQDVYFTSQYGTIRIDLLAVVSTSAIRPKTWYPTKLGTPTLENSLNNFRYAFFSDQHRLLVEVAGQQTLYDTTNHTITDVTQRQNGNAQEVWFTSQYGTIRVDLLAIVNNTETK